MKLGLVSAILDGWTFEEMMDTAQQMGFKCVEVACWPAGKAERRYAGVSHIDVDSLTERRWLIFWNTAVRRVSISLHWPSFQTRWMQIWISVIITSRTS